VRTYTDAQARPNDEIAALPPEQWQAAAAFAGEMQPPRSEHPGAGVRDQLVQSREGRYLWLRLELDGDGYATPTVSGARVHYPRDSYLAYLPAVYAGDDESRWFLERFLSIFQTDFDELERTIDDVPALFDPEAVPGGAALRFLADWLALPLEGEWDADEQRRLLAAAPSIYPHRGTANGLLEHLRIYLENLTGLALDPDGSTLPQLVEGFRERSRLLLGAEGSGGAPLWSASVVGRLQLDVHAETGRARLVSTGDPQRDLFHEYAHRFRVFVPAAWLASAGDELLVRRAIETERPAHAGYDLCLVEPRLRVGVQSTVGIDAVVGAYPKARLACPHETDEPPSLPPRHRLGYDTVLACEEQRGLELRAGVRVGVDTTLT
jgi:phage tail-like protein